MSSSGTVAARSAHFETLTVNAHVYRGVSRYDRSWTRRVRKRAFYEIRNQIAWLLQHGQKGVTAEELDDGNFMHPLRVAEPPVLPPTLMSTPQTSNERESRPNAPSNDSTLGVPGTAQLTVALPRAETASAASSSTSARAEPRIVPDLGTTAAQASVKRRRHEDADKADADDSHVPRKRRRIRRAVIVRRR